MIGNQNIIIDWVRHAESCANYDQGTVNDNFPKEKYEKNIGYQIISDPPVYQGKKGSRSNLTVSSNKSAFVYEPNLSFIGMQHAIMLDLKFVENEMNTLPYDIVFVSPLTRTIMTALMAFRHYPNIKIYVVPYISEHLNISSSVGIGSIDDYQNKPVSSYDLKKRIKFIKDWLETNWLEYYDDIEVITTLRYIRDDIMSRNSSDNNFDIKLNIVLNEITEALQCRPKGYITDYGLIGIGHRKIAYKTLCNMKRAIVSVVEARNSFNSNVQGKIDRLNDLLKPNIIRGPEVDFSILEKIENSGKDLHSNFEKFYEEILPEFLNRLNNHKILCVSHGSVMKEYFNQQYPTANISDVTNTQVFEEIISYNAMSFNGFQHLNLNSQKYLPISIRQSFQNFEYVNYDICRTESIKGIINYYMNKNFENIYENIKKQKSNKDEKVSIYNDKVPQDDALLVPASSYYTSFFAQKSIDYVNPDVKFYYNKKWSDFAPVNNIVKGGYYDKYKKYKQKYLELKKSK